MKRVLILFGIFTLLSSCKEIEYLRIEDLERLLIVDSEKVTDELAKMGYIFIKETPNQNGLSKLYVSTFDTDNVNQISVLKENESNVLYFHTTDEKFKNSLENDLKLNGYKFSGEKDEYFQNREVLAKVYKNSRYNLLTYEFNLEDRKAYAYVLTKI